jgi:hypothetical protein
MLRMKALIALAFVVIIGALAAAGLFMLRRKPTDDGLSQHKRMARALAIRVGCSVALFAVILLSWWMGWIHPTGIPAGQ